MGTTTRSGHTNHSSTISVMIFEIQVSTKAGRGVPLVRTWNLAVGVRAKEMERARMTGICVKGGNGNEDAGAD